MTAAAAPGANVDKEPSRFETRRRAVEEPISTTADSETPRRKSLVVDPASIPKAGKYWSHDDRYLGEDQGAEDERDSAKDVEARNGKSRKAARPSPSSPGFGTAGGASDARPQNARSKRMEERWTHDKFSTVNRSEEDGARRSPSRNAPDTQRRNINKPKPRKDEDTTEPLRICLSKVSVSPVVPLAADTAAADCTTSSHQDKPSTAASTANKDTLKEKHQAVVETASNVKTERDPSISVHTETKNSDKTFPVKPEPVVQPPQHSTVKESHQPTPPSLDRTDSDSRRPSSGKNQPPRRRSSNHHLRLSTKQSDLDYGMGAPQSAPVAGYHAYPSGAPTDPLYSPVDGPPPAFIPLNPYGSATYMPMMPGQMLMMTGNGLYIPAQSMYGYYQSGYDGYATSVPPPLVQSTSFDSTYSASTYAPSAPGGTTKSPRAGSKAIPIKAPGSIPPSGAKKSSSPVTLNSPLDKV